ncbi:MAG TPA: nuclease-related domain-containing protein [Anaerolineales bacterium]|nr:nuclease-related domain-containing protein [Anaerolineales bacterium]
MKIVKNEKLIKRNAHIGQYTSFAALGVLGVGMYISIKRQDLFIYSVACLILGFVMTQIGMHFANRWGRSPRPDEQLDTALKGIPSDTVLYHYTTPVQHLLVGPAGVWVLQTYHQKGKLSYAKNRWRLTGGGFMQAYMSVFGQEGIGRPDIDAANAAEAIKKYLVNHDIPEAEIPTIQSALVFTSEEAQVDVPDAPLPAMKVKQLKEFIRQRTRERSVGSMLLEQIKSALDGQEATTSE